MAESFKLKRFTNVAVLKRLDQKLLLKFLKPFRKFLVAQRGMVWPKRPEDLDHEVLREVLMSPDSNTPDALLDALYFVDSMADENFHGRILEECQEAGVDFGPALMSPEDLALRVWLKDPNILERVHAEQYRSQPKKFESFFATGSKRPDPKFPPSAVRLALEADLNAWFEFRNRGRGARIFPFPKNDAFWFLVRHGQRIKREGTVEADGEAGRVFYRPEKFDVLIYYADTGELAVCAETVGDQKAYCKLLGKHLFGSERFFEFEAPVAKYTLQPLIDAGRDALACGDVEGIERIRLVELHIEHCGPQKDVEVRRADEVFGALDAQHRDLASEADIRLIKAKFNVTFSGKRERTVSIDPPTTASFDREADNEVIHEWLTKRGFIVRAAHANLEVA